MKKMFKRAAAGLLALAMCAGLAGCYSEDKTWAAKLGEDTLPIGGYIYYLTGAYSNASSQVASGTDVLSAQVEGQDAKSWIQDQAMDYVYSYYFVNQKFDELGLSLDEEDNAAISNSTGTMWSYYKAAFESMGVAQSSFEKAFSIYNTKQEKVLLALYGKGGELEVPEEELKSYYLDNYTYYQYFSVELTKTDSEGGTVDMTEEEKKTGREILEDSVELINSGRQDFDKAVEKYRSMGGVEPTVSEPVALETSSLSTLFADGLSNLENGEAAFLDAGSRYYVVQKLDVEEDFEALVKDEDRTNTLLRTIKGEEFSDYAAEQGRGLNIELNQKAIGSVKLSVVADTMGRNGISSAESASSGEGDSSSAASSEESQAEASSASSEEE